MPTQLLKILYLISTCLLSLLIAPFFLLFERGRARFWDRFGCWRLPAGEYVWFHGASFGEVNGIIPVIRELRHRLPRARFLLTSTSITGLEKGKAEVNEARLLPFDSEIWLERALSGVSLRAFVVTEKEFWPGLLSVVKKRTSRVYLVNAVISDYSYPSFQRLRFLFRPMLQCFRKILCASEETRQRLLKIGLTDASLSVTGNSKYDHSPSVVSPQAAAQLKRDYFDNQAPVLVLGSIRPGEEDLWFPAIREALTNDLMLNVIVAPRHTERFSYFAGRLEEYLIPYRRWSKGGKLNEAVVLLDVLGKLESVYSFADVAFVGGSLVDWGGHNPLEPACYGACPVMGPFGRNVQSIVDDLLRQDGLILVKTAEKIGAVLSRIKSEPAGLKEIGKRAQSVYLSHRGATKKIVDELMMQLGRAD